jgi:hypothetical protein
VYNAASVGTRMEGNRRRARRWAPILLAFGLLGLAACEDEGDTVNVNGLDCGLIRDQLVGGWTVTYAPVARSLQNCDDASFNGTAVSVVAGTSSYTTNRVYGSPSSTSFVANATGPFGLDNELMANVEADSCLGLVQVWEDDDSGWVQCIGTADLTSHVINVICDSFDLDTDLDGFPDTACGLNGSVTATVVLP